MGIGNRCQHHLQGLLLFGGGHVEIIFEQFDGFLAHGGNHVRQVGHVVHTDIGLIVPVVVVAFIVIEPPKADAVQEVVFWIVFYHGTHIEYPFLHPFVFQGFAHRIDSAKDAHGLRTRQHDIGQLVQALQVTTDNGRLENAHKVVDAIHQIERILLIVHQELVDSCPALFYAIALDMWRRCRQLLHQRAGQRDAIVLHARP